MKGYICILVLLYTLLICGCSGHLYTVLNPQLESEKEQTIEGLIAYPVMDVLEVYKTTALVDDDKKIVGNAPGVCQPKISYKFSTRANYSKPYILKYCPGFLEKNSFSVTLKGGVVEAVNTTSEPADPIAALASLLPWAPGIHATASAGLVAESGLPFCNDGEVLEGIFAAPELKSYADIPK